MQRRVIIATCEDVGLLTSDRPFLEALAARDIRVQVEPWDARGVLWEWSDAVVVRSTWDYHRRFEQFLGWLDRLDERDVAVLNPTDTIRWNADKRYLFDLEAAGVPVVPTRPSVDATYESVATVMRDAHWLEAVVKPRIGASADGIARLTLADGRPEDWDEARFVGGALVQPFIPQFRDRGEWSLVYLDGRLSHSVLKKAAPGEFRVQSEFGGTAELAGAPPQVVRLGNHAIEAAVAHLGGRAPVQARVDCVQVGVSAVLAELELIEPELFFDQRTGERLAMAVETRIDLQREARGV